MNKEHGMLTPAMPLVTLGVLAFVALGRGLRMVQLLSATC